MQDTTIMITGASGSGKTTLAEVLGKELDRVVAHLDETDAWRGYMANREAGHFERRHAGDKDVLAHWEVKCRLACEEGFAGITCDPRLFIVEGAQILPFQKSVARTWLTVLLDPGRECCVQQQYARQVKKKEERCEMITLEWMDERLKKNHDIYDIWVPYLKTARANRRICLIPGSKPVGNVVDEVRWWLQRTKGG